MTITPERLATLDTLHLDKGAHATFTAGHCVMEAAAWLAGEPHSDTPACVAAPLRAMLIGVNDAWPDPQRQLLIPFLPRVIGTAGDGQDVTRSFLALDWLIRTYTPAWLDLAGLTAEAQQLRRLRRIADFVAAKDADPVVRQAQRSASAAAWDAAGVAAWAAAWDAAKAAAWDSARDAAGDAAGAAVGAAAGDAARDAAGAAAWDAARDAAGAAAWDAARDAAGAAAWDAARAAAGDAAGAAAWYVAGDAAGAAAGDAARDAAGDAAGDAAWYVAWDSAWDDAWYVAWDSAWDVLRPTVEQLQTSALALLAAMVNPAQALS